MKQHILFGYLIPLWIFVLTVLVVGFGIQGNEWDRRFAETPDWTRYVITIVIVGGAGYFLAVLVYLPYAIELVDFSAYLILFQAMVWAMLAITIYSKLQDTPSELDATFREFVWFGKQPEQYDCFCFGGYFVPMWFVMAISGILFWRRLSGTVKIGNLLYLSMFMLMLMTYIFPPSG